MLEPEHADRYLCCYDLELDLVTLIYELDVDILKVHLYTKMFLG